MHTTTLVIVTVGKITLVTASPTSTVNPASASHAHPYRGILCMSAACLSPCSLTNSNAMFQRPWAWLLLQRCRRYLMCTCLCEPACIPSVCMCLCVCVFVCLCICARVCICMFTCAGLLWCHNRKTARHPCSRWSTMNNPTCWHSCLSTAKSQAKA